MPQPNPILESNIAQIAIGDWADTTPGPDPPDSGWIALAVGNGWTSATPPGFAAYRKQGDVVRLRGSVVGGASGAAFATLPPGFCPVIIEQYAVPIAGGVTAAVVVDISGTLTPIFASGTELYLDVVNFTVD